LLLDGARELGHIVCSHIRALLNELHALRRRTDPTGAVAAAAAAASASAAAAAASTSPSSSSSGQPASLSDSDADADVERSRGVLQDRFTKDFVVVAAQTKPKTGGYELQLPSMASLTSKTSSQAFFLRILKVILQLRDAARIAANRNKRKQVEAANATAAAATAATTTATAAASASASVPAASTNNVAPENNSAPGATGMTAVHVTAEVPAPMEVDETVSAAVSEFELPRLSQQLLLDSLWNTLSECLQVIESIRPIID